MKRILILAALLLIGGCSTVKHSSSVDVETDQLLVAGVGDTMLRIEKVKSLPNAFGKADVFGRTTSTGLVTVAFHGLQDGKGILVRETTDIETHATTINSTPLVIPNQSRTTYSGNFGGTPIYGSSYTQGPARVVPAHGSTPTVSQRRPFVITVDPDKLPEAFLVEGYSINILKLDARELKYVVKREQRNGLAGDAK